MQCSPEMLARPDVFELCLRLDALLHGPCLSESMWGLELQLVGVTSCRGHRIDDTNSTITGELTTHPLLLIDMHLTPVGVVDVVHRLTAYELSFVN